MCHPSSAISSLIDELVFSSMGSSRKLADGVATPSSSVSTSGSVVFSELSEIPPFLVIYIYILQVYIACNLRKERKLKNRR